MIIRRDDYLNRLIESKHTRSVKVVSGIRRCGKSFLIFQLFAGHLLESGTDPSHILKYELDLLENAALRDKAALYGDILSKVADDGMHYVLIDEVQLVDGFYEVLNSLLHRGNVDVYVTGSNSRFLSKDIVTEFRGRSTEIRVRPLSFREFVGAKGTDPRDCIDEYMDYGGMPELFQYQSDRQKAEYLAGLMETVYLKDIVERHGVRNVGELGDLTDVMTSSIGSASSVARITDTMRTRCRAKITDKTVKKYIGYLCDAFLFEEARRYDIKGRRHIDSEKKYYIADTGLKNAREHFRQNEASHIMENVVYNELRCRGYDVDVGSLYATESEGGRRMRIGCEVDFVANRGNARVYIQSAYRMDEGVQERERRPYLSIRDSFRKVIVTMDARGRRYDEDGIERIGLIDFLMVPDSVRASGCAGMRRPPARVPGRADAISDLPQASAGL
ncbi:MAG: ATP-binding protein [Candidatus Methanomethylophilaceae archaeon]|nr:ATP-binding protein [Candidatus Methanomethylophilaceae archaeon]